MDQIFASYTSGAPKEPQDEPVANLRQSNGPWKRVLQPRIPICHATWT